ncbi:expressed unknown protein [Seminavis robusta]|uniref:Uncharacterized protein n=1 Tax=Seminavis robusta TaxID=568900 RepID=A0A9N8DL37_9STRA|nr:expressed unknown protein [Seminavis robusta]|eukprot:Sro204_g085860.1 n/a (819) ;mRNA; f:32281-34737
MGEDSISSDRKNPTVSSTTSTTTIRRRVVRKRIVSAKAAGPQSGGEPLTLPSWLKVLFQILLVEIPLSLLFGCFLLTNALLYLYSTVWFPRMQMHSWTPERAERELTHYDVSCDAASVVTTNQTLSLLLPPTSSPRDRVATVRKHGAGWITNLFNDDSVSRSTLQQFRSFALKKNQIVGNNENTGNVDVVGVIENDHRWSFAFGVDEDPSIAPLLEAIGRHTILQSTLEGLLGPNPALVELSTITAEAGAVAQGWHVDTTQQGDSLQYANTFSDLYSLLIPVQDTAATMGPTAICAGTQYCSHSTGCDEWGFSPLQQQLDNGTIIWKAGDGLLFNSHLHHQGTAHTGGPTRVAMVLSFVSSRNNNLLPPLAAGYVIPWTYMGFTHQDLAHASTTMAPPRNLWRSLGWTSQKSGWDYFSFCIGHMGNTRDPPLVVLMPFIKHLPLLLVGQANFHDTLSPWQVFVLDTLWRVWAAFLICTVLGCWGYLYMLLNTMHPAGTMNGSTPRKAGMGTVLVRLVILNGGMVALALLFVQQYTQDAINTSTTTTIHVSTTAFTEEYIQSLASPQALDVMMGPHFLDDAFQWIPGNRQWHAAAQDFLPWYLAAFPSSFSNAMVDSVLEQAITTGQGATHRVMMQNQYADWVELTNTQAREQTRVWMHRLLLSTTTAPSSISRHPCRIRTLARSALCNTFLNLDALFSPPQTNMAASQQQSANPKPSTWRRRRLLLSLVPPKDSCSRSTALQPCKEKEQSLRKTTFEVGEVVEARINSKTRKWLRATVIEKSHGTSYMVRFEVDLPEYRLEDPLPASQLRRIKSGTQS